MVGRLLAGGLADLGGWRLALGGIGLLALACAVLTRWLLPASRHFVAAPARPRQLLATTRRLVRDPALLALYGIGATLMGAFVAVYNAMGFRLAAEPYALSLGMAGLVFCVYPLGSLSSAYAGRLADRYGRRPVVPVACAVTAAGVLVTLARPLPVVVLGLAVLTAGFFAAHGVASGWVATRAHLGVGGTGQAASLYLFAYYLGSSVFGGLVGQRVERRRLDPGRPARAAAGPARPRAVPAAAPHPQPRRPHPLTRLPANLPVHCHALTPGANLPVLRSRSVPTPRRRPTVAAMTAVRRWGVLSGLLAPVLLVGGWTAAAAAAPGRVRRRCGARSATWRPWALRTGGS